MLRGENVACGTTTTGTGTLTLAATPAAVGALNFDLYLKGAGFVSGNAVLLPYTIIEYTDSTFATPSQLEKGIGTVTLGAAIANATLARTTPQVTQVGTTYDDSAPAAITIGTAANTLIFIGASAADVPAFPPYFEGSLGDAKGATPLSASNNGANLLMASGDTGKDFYWLIFWGVPILVKRATLRTGTTGYSGTTGSPVSTAFFRIYQIASNGRPGKLLIDLGALGGANPLNAAATNISTALHGSGIFLPPGMYWANFYGTWTGATGTVTQPSFLGNTGLIASYNSNTGVLRSGYTATGGANPGPDPANVTGYALSGQIANTTPVLLMSNA